MPDARPLAAKRIVVTRAAAQGGPLLDKLRALGATAVAAPAIEILPPEDDAPLRDAFSQLDAYAWLVCTSANGAQRALEYATDWPDALRIATVGGGTTEVFARAGHRVHFQPSTATGEVLARELPLTGGERLLWPRSALAKPGFADDLRARGAIVDDPIAYRTVASVELLGIADAVRDRRVDAVTFTSPSTVRHFVDGLAAAGVRLPRLAPETRPAVVCIGPVTAAAARECGLTVDAVADPHDDDGLVAAVIQTVSRRAPAASEAP